DLLRDDAELFDHASRKPGDTHLDTFEIIKRIDFLPKPSAHLRASIAGRETVYALRGIELVHQAIAVALNEPGIGKAGIETQGKGGTDRIGRILADEVVGTGVGTFYRSRADRVGSLQSGHDLASGEGLDGEIALGRRRNTLRNILGAAKDGIQ